MKLPLITFDIVLAVGATPVLTVYREDDAARIVGFLMALVRDARVALPDDGGATALAPHYVRVSRVIETPFAAPSEALAAYFTLDEPLMARVLDVAVREHEAEQHARETGASAPVVDEPAPADEIVTDGGGATRD